MPVHWDLFPSWLIDHHEGDTITEELLQHALADMLKVYPPITAPSASAQQAEPAVVRKTFIFDGVRNPDFVPLRIEFEPGYPEDVAFGTQRQMDRLKKWLDKFFAMRAAQSASPACSECGGTGTSDGRDGALIPCLACKPCASPADQVEDARDAARYRWIAKNAHFTGSYKNVGGFGVCVKLDVLESEGIGAAIDAAMSATPPAAEGE